MWALLSNHPARERETSWLPSKKESNTWGGKILTILEFLNKQDNMINEFLFMLLQFLTKSIKYIFIVSTTIL